MYPCGIRKRFTGDNARAEMMRCWRPHFDAAALQLFNKKVSESKYVIPNRLGIEIVHVGKRRGETGGSYCFGHAMNFKAPGVWGQREGNKRRERRVAQVFYPSFARFSECEQTVRQSWLEPLERSFANVKKTCAEGRVQPLLRTRRQKINLQPGQVERNCTQLLNAIDHQETITLFRELRESRQVHAQAIDPLHRT